ncbi:cryptochrome/photolyase family protein [Oxalicibacterium faecigallinarum]|uniref:Cryptochrome/photolyase family protein n=1 Tax=Oxalicibacterium faecigallinarum TaxID=573741 RepID=A0A8J3ANK7_9BURK|nr:cryptochrome/photolyase family protein [Oxalicibacterium faecigallinarum]GGI15984.1 cryptochrome/photolyase family protein [Oxalicibacterium faecigallinarum]
MQPLCRLILGDQLNPNHSWFGEKRRDVIYLMMEVRQETDYVLHHAQKIIAIFAGMRDFARHLREQGHRVHYLHIDDAGNLPSLTKNLDRLLQEHDASGFEYQAPDEWRLDEQLAQYIGTLGIPARMVDSEHFYTTRDEAFHLFEGRQHWLMEHFYRQMRIKHNVLMSGPRKPVGAKWNFDHDNRKSWSGTPREPEDVRTLHDHSVLWESIRDAGVNSFGRPSAAAIPWPLNREQALQQLDHFIDEALPHFGDFQDAMHTKAPRLFHSLLSFALNTKMLDPREVVEAAEQAYRRGHAPLPAVEGFIRQILGWREYVRGVYWAHMPGYDKLNVFKHETPLPHWFWDGKTRMRCLSHAIGQSLDDAHAHHIQRLMVIGNFALLAGLAPQEVHEWYLGVYVDAFEWVELPNTLGMSQFVDHGMLATKPYVSSAAYIHRMSDYCKGCHYDRRKREEDDACPFNALYWDFFDRHADLLSSNPRLGMVYVQLAKMSDESKDALRSKAHQLRRQLEDL